MWKLVFFAETPRYFNIITESTRVQDVDKMTLISENSPVVRPSNRDIHEEAAL